ncbi:MAG: glycosyltransferase family 2 protein [Ilumatobacter sp.]|uniref:glycosyltransferase family 2 protein n=1 Tax=Ilumatobacter sp. TaxID=1967498 RepID=UPI002606CA5C|nr:glycosyltransferase family 2 protein [Ilumatobacter sp.]MDJ0768377.1 glycosyltransferase family 2 protein [Ilumatobacter sp.]
MSESGERLRKLVIQIPCLNEEETLPATLADLPREVEGVDVVEWLIIDDGSTDGTVDVARAHGVDHVVQHPRNRGLAAAFLTGLDAALRAGADVVVNTDADNQYDGSCIPELIGPVLRDGADMVVGERPIEQISEFSGLKKRLQRLGSWVVRRFSGTDIRDAASGFRALSRDAALRLQVYGKYSYTMETLVQARAEGLAVEAVPIRVNPQTRPSRLVRSTGQYVRRSAQTIVRSFALYYPFRFFFIMGLLPLLIGLALLVRWLAFFVFADEYQSRIPSLVVGAVFTLVGVQIWLVGFLGDLQAASRRLLAEARVRDRHRDLGRP